MTESGSRGMSAARTTSPSATSSSSRCPVRCCPVASPSRRARRYGHVSDGMICSASELGPRRRSRRDPGARPKPDLAPGADAAPVLQLRDEVLDIAVTPDRGYCLSIRGLAREAAQAIGVAFTIR